MTTFFEELQQEAKAYACSIGSDPWYAAALTLAASGQGVSAGAAAVGGIATQMLCDEPKLLPPGQSDPGPNITLAQDGLTGLGTAVEVQVYAKIDGTQPARSGSDWDCSRIVDFGFEGLVKTRTVSGQYFARWRTRSAPVTSCPGAVVFALEESFNGTSWVANPVLTAYEGYTAAVAVSVVRKNEPPDYPTPAPPPPRNIDITFNLGGLNITNNITINPPDFIFAPSGDFVLSFPVTINAGPLVYAPVNFNFDLNLTSGQGEPSGGDGYGTKPSGGGPKLPVTERPTECPEIPEDPNISGSWSKADCVNGELLFTPVNWKGKGFSGVADALNKLNSVIGPWQENTYDCDDNLPAEPMVGVPVSQYTGVTSFEPSITLWFYEPNLLAIQAGRSYRVRRCITVPVATPPANPQAFLDGEIAYWEGFEWQCGFTTCRASLTGGRSFVLCNAINAAEGERVLTRVFTRYGFAFDKSGGFRATVGASPSDSTGRGGLRIQTTVRFHSASFATMNQTWGPISPDSVYAQGRNKFA